MNTNHMDSNQMQEQEIDLIELFYKLLEHLPAHTFMYM